MGFLDFLKEKNTDEFSEKKNNALEGDVSKTKIIIELLEVPVEKRDDKWKESFLTNIQSASFSESIPQLSIGPDEFPYFVLKTNEHFNPFESFCIVNMTNNFLLKNGFGIVVNPVNDDADWVFTYGDILNLYLNGEFYSNSENKDSPEISILESDTEVLVSQPSEKYLPGFARKVIKLFLQKSGIKLPKILMISRPVNGKIVQELFLIYSLKISLQRRILKYVLHRISWYLPKHYRIVSISQKSVLNDNFELL